LRLPWPTKRQSSRWTSWQVGQPRPNQETGFRLALWQRSNWSVPRPNWQPARCPAEWRRSPHTGRSSPANDPAQRFQGARPGPGDTSGYLCLLPSFDQEFIVVTSCA
jgi:hypothetical protein